MMKKIKLLFLFCLISQLSKSQIPGDLLFNSNNIIHTVKFTFPDTNWYSILVNNYNNSNLLDSNIYYSCSVEIDGTLLQNVGVKFKGNSSWTHPNNKKSFKISFGEFVNGQKFDSLKQINLNNCFNDPSFLREKLYLDVLKQNNIEAPRCQYAQVFVNNQAYAFYTIVEEIDKVFLKTHYGGNGGNLYKGDPKGDMKWEGWIQSMYYNNFELKTNNTINDWSDLVSLINVINNTPFANLLDSLEKNINIHQFVKHYASYIVFATLDSYVGSGHNFFVYYNKQSNQFEFIQWDTNGSFGRHKPTGQGLVDETYLHPFFQFVPIGSRPLTDDILKVNVLKNEFINSMCDLNQNYLNPNYLYHQIDSISNIIKPYVYADTRKQFTNQAFDSNLVYQVSGAPGLKNFSSKRYIYLKDTLSKYGCCPATIEHDLNKVALNIYPNPAINEIHIDSDRDIFSISIYNILGEKLYHNSFHHLKKITIDLHELDTGLYILEINNSIRKKINKY